MKEKGLKLLYQLQCMYQQNLISVKVKNDMAKKIHDGMVAGSYDALMDYIDDMERTNENSKLLEKMEEIIYELS